MDFLPALSCRCLVLGKRLCGLMQGDQPCLATPGGHPGKETSRPFNRPGFLSVEHRLPGGGQFNVPP